MTDTDGLFGEQSFPEVIYTLVYHKAGRGDKQMRSVPLLRRAEKEEGQTGEGVSWREMRMTCATCTVGH